MMSKHFNWFDNWREEILTCETCGWTGTFNEGYGEVYDELIDSHCPVCGWLSAPCLAIVSFPTIDDYLANEGKLSESEKSELDFLKRVEAKYKKVESKKGKQG